MKKHAMLWAGVLLFGASLAWAQNGPDRVCEVNVTTPKPGGAKMFEDARKKHNDFHKAEKDKNAIEVWSITTGPSSGNYLTAVCGMTWKEMDGQDGFDQRDDADRQKTLAPTISANTQSYFVFRPDLSNSPAPGGDAKPSKMMTVVHYFVKPSGVVQFQDAIKKINAAIAQTKYPAKPSRWYSLANGGDGPHYVLVTDRNGFADMQPPEQTMTDMLKQAYGDDKALQQLRDALDHIMSEMMVYRADLSYTPAK